MINILMNNIITEKINNELYYINSNDNNIYDLIKDLLTFLYNDYDNKKNLKSNDNIINDFLNDIDLIKYNDIFNNNLKDQLLNLFNNIINEYKLFINNNNIIDSCFNYSNDLIRLNLFISYCYYLLPINYNDINNNLFKSLFDDQKTIKDNLYNLLTLKEKKDFYFNDKELIKSIDILLI